MKENYVKNNRRVTDATDLLCIYLSLQVCIFSCGKKLSSQLSDPFMLLFDSLFYLMDFFCEMLDLRTLPLCF